MERACNRCGVPQPFDRYHFKPRTNGTLNVICRECFRADARRIHQQKRLAEIEAMGPFVLPTERACTTCDVTKPLTREFFDRRKGCVAELAYRCKECRRAANRALYRGNAEYRRRRLDAERIRRRLKAEAEGREVRPSPRATNGYRENTGGAVETMPAEPLALWLDEVVRREIPNLGRGNRNKTLTDLADEWNVSPKRLWSLRHRAQSTVSTSAAEKMLMGYGRPVRIDAEQAAASLEAYCRDLPGNGERLLRYIDMGEQVAHLADVTVDVVGDLWPELAS